MQYPGSTEAEELAATTLSQGCLDFQKVATVIRSSKLPIRMQPSRECIGHVGQEPFKSWTLGTWRRGGVVGISTLTRERPNLVKLVNKMLQACHPAATWTSITTNDGVTVMPHRDSNNEPHTKNMIICLDGAVEGTGGGLWVENPQGKAFRQIKPGMHLAGEVHNLRHQPLQFDPSLWHGTEPWTGKRLVVTAYTAGLWDKVPEEDRSRLRTLNFPLPSQCAEAVAQHISEPDSNISTHNNLEAAASNTGGGEDHCEFWAEVCNAQAGVSVDQGGSAPVEFGEECFGESVGEPDGPCAMAVEECDELDSALDWCEELEGLDDEEHAKRKSLKDLMAQGLRHPHRKLKAADVALGSLAIDIAGPYKEGFGGFKYGLIGVFTFQHSGPGLHFVRLLRSRKVDEVQAGVLAIISQLTAMTGSKDFVVRLHSDNALEFVTQRFSEHINSQGIFETKTVPHNPASNGRAERAVQSLKRAALAFLIEGGLERRFWPYCILEAASCQRDGALGSKLPKLVPGDSCAVKVEQSEPFEPKVETARYLARDPETSKGAFVLVKRNGRDQLARAREPVKLEISGNEKWRPCALDDKHFWVSSKGRVKEMTEHIELPTLEERLFGPGGEELVFGASPEHGDVVAKVARVSKGSRSGVNPAQEEGKYAHWSSSMEQEALDAERMATILAEQQLVTETVGNEVLTSGSALSQQKWRDSVTGEIGNMTTKEVWIQCKASQVREKLGLREHERTPIPLPMKLVLTRKPLLEGGDLTEEKHLKDQIPKAASDLTAASAQELAELAELAAFKAKCRLVVCGNFEQQPGDDISCQNVDADTLRFLAHQWASNRNWKGFAFDISAAFLNSWLSAGTKITMKPPAILVRLGYFDEDTILIPQKSLYGLRRAPRDWEQERSAKMDGAVLPAAETDELGDLVLHPHSDIPGLWTVMDGEEIVGYVTMFVDDGLGIGHSEAMLRVVDHIRNTWKATAQGYMGWDDEHNLSRGSLTVPRVSEFIFLGLRITLSAEGLSLDQHKWLAQELQKRALTQMTGTGCLPNLDDAPREPESRGDAYEKDVKACQREVGSMMWAAMRTRPDIQAVVSMAACMVTVCPSYVLRKLKQVWRYIRKTLWLSLRFVGSDSRIITVYTDASFAPQASRSRTGVVLQVGPDLISWRSVRQSLTAWSTCEAETEAIATGIQDAVRLQSIVQGLTNVRYDIEAVSDSASAVVLICKPSMSTLVWRTRHFGLRAAWVRDQVAEHAIALRHESGETLVADALTKSLPRARLEQLRILLNLFEA